MYVWLKIIGKILKVLKDGATPGQIAGGFTLGMMIGLIPGWPLQVWLLVFIALLLNVNLTMVMVSTSIFALTAWLIDPLVDWTGLQLLELAFMKGPYTTMYNNTFLMLTRFNNTVVMGAGILSFLLAAPFFFVCKVLVVKYREEFLARLDKFKIVKAFKGSFLFNLYQRLESAGFIR